MTFDAFIALAESYATRHPERTVGQAYTDTLNWLRSDLRSGLSINTVTDKADPAFDIFLRDLSIVW